MTTQARSPVVVPAIPPQPPQLSLLNSAIRPDNTSDPDIGGSLRDISSEQLALLPAELRSELEARKGEAWTRGITYAPENHWAAELRDACDTTGVDAPAIPAPSGLALSEAAGGSITAAEYEYQVTAKNANGETTARTATKITTTKTGSIKLTWTRSNEEEGTKYVVYGRAKGSLKKLKEVGPLDINQAAEWVDTGAESPGSAKPPLANTTGGKGSYTNLPIVTAIPYLIMVEDYCSTFGFEERDFKGRAERLLENAEHQAIEKEFWTGTLAQAKELPNNYLTKAGTATSLTPLAKVPSVNRGLQILQDALQTCGFGGRGMIHTQAQTAPNFLGARRVGPLLLDVFDNIIVPGVGYPGTTGPEGVEASEGNAWMFATDLVMVRVEDKPTVFTEAFSEMTDWGQAGEPNTIRLRAQKFAVAYADFACAFACEVKLPE